MPQSTSTGPIPPQADPAGDPTPSRRAVLGAALATAGAIATGAASPPAARAGLPDRRSAVRRGTGDRAWLRLRLDAAGRGEPVPVPIGTEPSGGRFTVTVTTGRATVSSRVDGGPEESIEVEVGGTGETTVWVTPRSAGPPGEPGDRLVVDSAAGREEIPVWIEPVPGRWYPAGPERTELELGIVAIHAALLRTSDGAEVVMYSLARERGPDGRPVPNADRPGQWEWNIFSQDDLEVRALDLATLNLRDRPMDPAIVKNIFCSGLAILPDGRLLTVGGHRTNDDSAGHNVHNSDAMFIYDPSHGSGWTRLDATLDPLRWYPTVTTLPDGQMLITSGSLVLPKVSPPGIDAEPNGYWNQISNTYQVFDPARLAFVTGPTELVDQGQLDTVNDQLRRAGADPVRDLRFQQLATYPSVFVVPGKEDADTVVAIAESNRAWLYGYESGRTAPLRRADPYYPMRTEGSRSYPQYGSAVLLPLEPDSRRARVLVVGGQHEDNPEHRSFDDTQPATATAEILEIDADRDLDDQPGWRRIDRMAHPRILCDATLLADGRVLVSGGARRGWGNHNHDAVHEAELFDPVTDTFHPAAAAETDRRYHATALLQPDGTVLKAGSTGGFGDRATETDELMEVHTTAERYHPSYLWRGPRPTMVRVDPGWNSRGSSDLYHGGTFTITATGQSLDGAARVALIQPGATTHGNNMSQRFVWLEVRRQYQEGEEWLITAVVPANPAAAPPGDYLVVVVDSDGVPSVAEFARIAVPGGGGDLT
jgi:hypothetical protein